MLDVSFDNGGCSDRRVLQRAVLQPTSEGDMAVRVSRRGAARSLRLPAAAACGGGAHGPGGTWPGTWGRAGSARGDAGPGQA